MRNPVVTAVLCALMASGCSRGVVVGTSSPDPSRDPVVTSADQLLDAMHRRYSRTWYRNLTFVQKSTYLRPDGSTSRVETWYEAGTLPGRLRIDLGEPSRGNGVLYRGDSAYSMQSGRIADRRISRNPLMILGFDVYAQAPSVTFDQLRAEKFDMTVMRRDTLDGKRVYVVGAGPGDYRTAQFWIEEDRLLFVRMIQTDARNRTQDVRFANYVQHAGGWVAETVRIFMDGKLFFLEEYQNVRVNVTLDENLFIPERWSTATHWFKP
ncbi:MAG TPA: hypothetical protein VEB19_07995 [Gemmatimonadaceae bacterium]|nr:hypothetical protein [Gemmatimonadaceae bacterium]